MLFEALIAATAVALTSLVGAFFFGTRAHLYGIERYVVPLAVGIFMSLVLYELIPETLAAAPEAGGIAVAFGFIAFYIIAQLLHRHFHDRDAADCDKKGAAALLLIGDSVHNFADGIVLGSAFLIDPTVGIAVAIGLALHEIPQEIVEFGVFIRAGYTRKTAMLRNFISASGVIWGTLLVLLISGTASEWLWVVTGVAAGNLLFLAASDLLPRIHGNLKDYGSVWHVAASITVGFVLMTLLVSWAHSEFGHGHDHEAHTEEAHDDHDDHEAHADEVHDDHSNVLHDDHVDEEPLL